jgi:transposase
VIADMQKVKGAATLARRTDKIAAWVPAELSRRDLLHAIWLPTPVHRAGAGPVAAAPWSATAPR